MFNIGPVELMVVLVIALLVFGPAKLPELMGSVGNAIREFQRASRELTDVFQETQQEFTSAMDLETAASATSEPTAAAEAAPPFAAEAPQTAQPEELDTAAAMLDPVEPFPAPAPEPVAATAGAAGAAAKPKRSRRKPAAEPTAAEVAVGLAEAAPVEPLSDTVPAEPAAEASANGAAPRPPVKGAAPKPRLRKRETVAATGTEHVS